MAEKKRKRYNSRKRQQPAAGQPLVLTIKRKWFEMILSGEKKEEYREIKPYYETRFRNLWRGSLIGGTAERHIMFRNGYSADSPKLLATVTIDTGEGREEWGAVSGVQYYRLHIKEVQLYD